MVEGAVENITGGNHITTGLQGIRNVCGRSEFAVLRLTIEKIVPTGPVHIQVG